MEGVVESQLVKVSGYTSYVFMGICRINIYDYNFYVQFVYIYIKHRAQDIGIW